MRHEGEKNFNFCKLEIHLRKVIVDLNENCH